MVYRKVAMAIFLKILFVNWMVHIGAGLLGIPLCSDHFLVLLVNVRWDRVFNGLQSRKSKKWAGRLAQSLSIPHQLLTERQQRSRGLLGRPRPGNVAKIARQYGTSSGRRSFFWNMSYIASLRVDCEKFTPCLFELFFGKEEVIESRSNLVWSALTSSKWSLQKFLWEPFL